MATLLLQGNGKSTLFQTDAKSFDFHELEAVIVSCINPEDINAPRAVEVKDANDIYTRTLWTHTPTPKSIYCNGYPCISIARTIAHHTEEILTFLEGLTDKGIEHRRNSLYAERQ